MEEQVNFISRDQNVKERRQHYCRTNTKKSTKQDKSNGLNYEEKLHFFFTERKFEKKNAHVIKSNCCDKTK